MRLARLFAIQIMVSLLFAAFIYLVHKTVLSANINLDNSLSRCECILDDVSRPMIAICSGAACLLLFRNREKKRSLIKSLLVAYLCSWVCMLGYVIRMAYYIWRHLPCSALYSPGPGFLHSIIFGGPLVLMELIIESSLWAFVCAIPLFICVSVFEAIHKKFF
jgi:hypothetical protein